MHRTLTTLTAITAFALLTMSGCATSSQEAPPSEPTTSTSPAPSSSEPPTTPTPTAASEVPEADPEDPSTWQVSADGIGPIATGGDFAATLADLPETWSNDEHCSWAAWWNAEDQSYSVDFVRGTESEQEPIVLASASAADPITPGVGPRTEDGLGIGSTKDEVLAVYPDATEGHSQIGDGTWLGIPTASATIFFEYYTSDQANAVTVTTLEAPPYEVCG